MYSNSLYFVREFTTLFCIEIKCTVKIAKKMTIQKENPNANNVHR